LKKSICTALLAISLILSACSPGAQAVTTPTPNAQTVLTAAALTAQAKMTELAAAQPSPLPSTPTLSTITPGTPTVTPTVPAGGSPTSAITVVPGGTDRVEYVADLTVPDGTIFKPGEKFTKTWRLLNAGTSTWTTAYSLVFSSGEQMDGAASTPLTLQVPPGQTVDLSVELTAPSEEGKYTGYWMLRNSAGSNFGMGANADGAFYVLINVSGNNLTPTATSGTGTTAASATPTQSTTSSGETVTEASLSVDAANVEGDCPYTFTFTASFTLSKAALVTYRLDVDASFPVNLPGPSTASLNAGTSEITYTLDFTDSVDGTAILHITSPENVQSDPVSFSLACQ
jgi:hypothetical protein